MDNKEYWNNGKHLWVTSKDMKSVHIVDSLMKISDSALEQMTIYPKGTLLLVTRSGILRHTLPIAILDKEATINQDIKTISCYYPHLQTFIYYAIKAQEQIILKEYHKDGTTVDSIDFDKFKKLPIPLPPLKEQKRIIAEIAKWFSLIDTIENNKDDLQETIQQAKSKILDLAIHGKLVPQDPNDEPASELLKRINPNAGITCDNGQYGKIPEGWSLCQLGDIGEIITGNTPTKDIAEYYGGSIPFYKPTDLDKGKCVKNASENLSILGFEQARKLPINSILVTCIGATIGKTGLITAEGSCNQQINAIIPNNAAFAEFVYYVCISDYLQEEIKQNASATTLPILNKRNFAKLLFPLPPLPEQHRIVAKIEELFSKLDQIEKSLEA